MTTTTQQSIDHEALELRELKQERDEAKAQFETLDHEFQRRQTALFERMDANNVQSLNVDGTNFVRTETAYAQVQDRAEFVQWATDNDDTLLERKERKALLNALVREHLDNGEPMPPGIGHYVKQYIAQRAG